MTNQDYENCINELTKTVKEVIANENVKSGYGMIKWSCVKAHLMNIERRNVTQEMFEDVVDRLILEFKYADRVSQLENE